MSVSESVHKPFKRQSEFPDTFFLVRMARISTYFQKMILWGLFFPALEPWAGNPWYRSGASHSSSGTSTAKIFLLMFNHRT